MAELKGKKALVTGGSRGIGAAIAKQLASEGADVAITYRASVEMAKQVVTEIKQYGVNGIALQADARQAENVAAAVKEVIRQLGGLDIAILFRLWQFSKLKPLLYLDFKPSACCILFRIAIFWLIMLGLLIQNCSGLAQT